MKDKLELCVLRLSDSSAGLREKALETIKDDVASATSSMTSVPKPLKFMTPQYEALTECHKNYTNNDSFKVSLNLHKFILINYFVILIVKHHKDIKRYLPIFRLMFLRFEVLV